MTNLLEHITREQVKAVKEVILSGKISELEGSYVDRFEKLLAEKFDCNYATATNSGTAALHCALYALNISKNDEILVPPLAVPMSLQPLLQQDANIIFFDLDKTGLDYDFDDLESKINKKTKMIMPVYLWGILPNIAKLKQIKRKYGLQIIEDASQAHGTTYQGKYAGSLFDVGCFSTNQYKLISTGEGGFILTNNKTMNSKLRIFKNNNLKQNRIEVGFNYRITDLSAALGWVDTQYLKQKLKKLEKNRDALISHLNGQSLLVPVLKEGYNDYNILLIINQKHNNPEKIHKSLMEEGIFTDWISYGFRPANTKKIAATKNQKCPNAEAILPYIINIPNIWKEPSQYYSSIGKVIKKIVS